MKELQEQMEELKNRLANLIKKNSRLEIHNQQLSIEKKELKFKVNLMEDILDNMHEAVHAVDTEGKIIIYSKPNEKYTPCKKEDAIGQHEGAIWKQPSNFVIDKEKIIREAKPIKNISIIGNSLLGKEFHIIAGLYPYFENGEFRAFYYTGRDNTKVDSLIMETYELKRKINQVNKEKNMGNGCQFTLDDIVGNSSSIEACKDKALKIANYNANILIYGETGTGKELFAQGIHNASFYAHEPFIALNCSAVPETLIESLLFGTVKGAFTGAENMPGVFEQVGKGTLFLDEINSMPLYMQAKLLRVLQEKKIRRIGDSRDIDVDCCIISATNMNPSEAVKKNILREDFYYRIATVQLTIEPLRDRKEDIPILINHFIDKYNHRLGKKVQHIDSKVMDYFLEYQWPGNVRELINTLECAIMLAEDSETTLTAEYFPNYIHYRRNKSYRKRRINDNEEAFVEFSSNDQNLRILLEDYEKEIIIHIINANNNNISAAAKDLGIDRKSLYRKIEKYNLK